jgi:selenocysteine lyase/cysteine desulfurase
MTATTQTRIDALVNRADFLLEPGVAHLCAGGETPILRSHTAAVERFFADKSQGQAGRMAGLMGLLERTRTRAGALLGVPADDVAFLGSSTEGINQLVGGVDWQPGDNVVVEDIEFPSDIYLWTRLAARGVEVRVVRQWGGEASLARLADALDARTRVLAVSQVSFLTGRRYELAELAEITHRTNALLSVDATHAAGVVPVEARHADLLVTSCYKFLLAVHGVALCYVNPARLAELAPRMVGWNSSATLGGVADPTTFPMRADARRFEAANPPFMNLAVLENALAYLDHVGVERIEQHVLALGTQLRAALATRGLPLLTPDDPAQRGPNVCFLWPEPEALVARLAEHGVLAWGDSGRIRVSFHAYNDSADIERFLTALDACSGARVS